MNHLVLVSGNIYTKHHHPSSDVMSQVGFDWQVDDMWAGLDFRYTSVLKPTVSWAVRRHDI